MFQKIIVPLDGSPTAEAIVPFVQEIAAHSGAEIVLVTAVQAVAVWDTTVTITSMETEEASATDYLKGVMARVPGKQRCRVARGESAEAILEAADEENADLIAISTHGRSGIARFLFGSTAGKVLERAKVPVLFLRPKTGEDKGAPGAVFKKILVPLDGSELAHSILPSVEAFAKSMGASLILFHAVTPIAALPGFETQAPTAVTVLTELQKHAHEFMNKLAEEVNGRGVEATALVGTDDPVHAILEAAEEANVDLIALASHGRGGLGRALLGSVADNVVRKSADVPCLVLRSTEG